MISGEKMAVLSREMTPSGNLTAHWEPVKNTAEWTLQTNGGFAERKQRGIKSLRIINKARHLGVGRTLNHGSSWVEFA